MQPVTLLATWKILEEIVIEFRKKGIFVSQRAINDLKTAKSLITLMETCEKNRTEKKLQIGEYLGSVEAQLISEAQKSFSNEVVDKWLEQLKRASCEGDVEEKKEKTGVTGLPRGQKWIRVKPIGELSMDKLKTLADELDLSFKIQDEQLTVYGDVEVLKEFIKKVAAQTSKKH